MRYSKETMGQPLETRAGLCRYISAYPHPSLNNTPLTHNNSAVARVRELSPPGAPPFESISVSAGTGGVEEFAIYDAFTGKTKVRGGEKMFPNFLRGNRKRLREWLSTGVNIRWGKQFVRCEESGGVVTAYFADGTTAEGSILIGADGVNSPGKSPSFLIATNMLSDTTFSAFQYLPAESPHPQYRPRWHHRR